MSVFKRPDSRAKSANVSCAVVPTYGTTRPPNVDRFYNEILRSTRRNDDDDDVETISMELKFLCSRRERLICFGAWANRWLLVGVLIRSSPRDDHQNDDDDDDGYEVHNRTTILFVSSSAFASGLPGTQT